MEEMKVTAVISVELDKWMDLHFQKIALEYERDDIRRKLWNEMSKVEQMKTEIKDLEKKLEDAMTYKPEFREIDLVDITRQDKGEE